MPSDFRTGTYSFPVGAPTDPYPEDLTSSGYTYLSAETQWLHKTPGCFGCPVTFYPDGHPNANYINYRFHYTLTPSGSATGDPHITTFDGDKYTL